MGQNEFGFEQSNWDACGSPGGTGPCRMRAQERERERAGFETEMCMSKAHRRSLKSRGWLRTFQGCIQGESTSSSGQSLGGIMSEKIIICEFKHPLHFQAPCLGSSLSHALSKPMRMDILDTLTHSLVKPIEILALVLTYGAPPPATNF